MLARGRGADLAVAPFGLMLPALLVVLAAKDGGFAQTVWMPAAVFAVALVAIPLWSSRRIPLGPALWAIVALAGLVLVMAASIAWAHVRGDAWAGTDRTLFYLVLFALCVALPWRPHTAIAALSLYALGVTAVALWQFLQVAHDPKAFHGFFVVGRLATPISYPNANCALLAMAALPLLVLAAQREVPLIARGVFLGAAGIAAQVAIATQSRLSLLAAPLAVLAVFALVGSRLRLATVVLPFVIVVGATARPVLHLYAALGAGVGAAELADARRAILAAGAILLVVGWALAAVDLRYGDEQRVRRLVTGLVVVALAIVLAAAAVVVRRAVPHPVSFVRAQWNAFVTGSGYYDQRASHFTSIGTNRYAVWSAAAHEFAGSPIGGVGVDNFPLGYLRHRQTPSENPLYPHSILLSIVAQTGLAGGAAFVAFLACVVFGLAAVAGRRGRVAAASIACFAPFLYFFLHGLGDWFWEMPALGAAALAFLGVSLRLADGERLGARMLPRAPRWAVAVALAVLLLAIVPPWLAARETALAASRWPEDVSLAYRRLALANRLNPLSDVPWVTEGVIAARAGDPQRARHAFEAALGRNASDWYSYAELAVVESELGEHRAAVSAVERARALNPVEPLLELVEQRIRSGRVVTQAYLDRLVSAADRATVGVR